MLQLLADRATVGVEAMDAAELDEWLATDPGVDADSLELAAAAIALSVHGEDPKPLPAALRRKLLAAAEVFFADGDGA
jgi:hypothetical protein